MVVMAVNGYPDAISPNIPPVRENGRFYHGYMKGMYMYPCDEMEMDRMDIFHKFFQVARHDQLHEAPLIRVRGQAPRILDLGTGTGIWAIDMADKYPDSTVFGLDLANIQPERIPRNLRFRIPQDYESPWNLGESSFSLIHLRIGSGSVSSWPELYQRVFDHLLPETGWFEQVELDLEPRCDDETLPPHSLLRKWWGWLADATQRVNRPLAYNQWTGHMLQRAGFVDIREKVICAPLSPWPAEPHLKDVARWYNLGTTEGLEAYSLAPLTRIFKWSAEDVSRVTADVKKEMDSKRVHAYNNIHIWTARRPSP